MPGLLFCNDKKSFNSDALKGMKAAHAGLFISVEKRMVLLNRDRGDRVAVISGCGSGHEPFPMGFVGENFLTGCLMGNVFGGPTVPQILNAIFNLNKWNRGGIMIIAMNSVYNSLNFRLAAKRAMDAGVKVKMVVMSDDCALERNHIKYVHENMMVKRGLCGIIICAKILGGMSTAGFGLEQIYHHGTMIKLRTNTISACYSSCQTPNSCRRVPQVDPYEVVIGVGGHGEEGLKRVEMAPLHYIVKVMVKQIFEVFMVSHGDKVLLFLNNSGVCTESEMFVLAREVELQLAPRVLVVKTIVGKFYTSLDMKGFQICITNVTSNESWLRYMELGTDAFAWPSFKLSDLSTQKIEHEPFYTPFYSGIKKGGWKLNYGQAHIFGDCIQSTCIALKRYEDNINAMDAVFRTGDVGTKLKAFADRALKDIKGASLLMDMSKTFELMAQIAENEIDTIMGQVLAVLFTGSAQGSYSWENVWKQALDTLSMYTTARVGHRTLLDSLIPAYRAYKAVIFESGPRFWVKALKNATAVAKESCEKTKHMIPMTWIVNQGEPELEPPHTLPDPGAFVVTLWLDVVLQETTKKRKFCGGNKKNVVISKPNK
ncbi:PTS-dependent dihydroxyacetone kinase 1, dihydroxyacetone-binding subunit DhaK [Halyomorpha halys]|uniref:PTS-dependent dihydroxyacetone kinase 1, dihydroxyacetone-binding subunit DhaK n=1 Tax=Halyomorpha halys TaxID=286706 RepID=UPI0006D4FDFD|nr:uncharacterized protein LOC106678475 [Halyomorpha halys]